jgi:hypothetical protein
MEWPLPTRGRRRRTGRPNRIAGAATSEERAAVLRGIPYIDTAGLGDGDHVPLRPPPGGTLGSN